LAERDPFGPAAAFAVWRHVAEPQHRVARRIGGR